MLNRRKRTVLKQRASGIDQSRTAGANSNRGPGLGRNHSPKGPIRRRGLRKGLGSRPLRKEQVLAQIKRTQQKQQAESQRLASLLSQVSEPGFQKALHSKIAEHLRKIPFSEFEKKPGPEVVRPLALDLVILYAGMTKLRSGDLAKLKKLARVELNPKTGASKKNEKFRDIIGKGKVLFRELEEMDAKAHSLAEENRLLEVYRKNRPDKLLGRVVIKMPAGKERHIPNAFVRLLVERAAQTASIALADSLATLKLVQGKPLKFKGKKIYLPFTTPKGD